MEGFPGEAAQKFLKTINKYHIKSQKRILIQPFISKRTLFWQCSMHTSVTKRENVVVGA